MKGIEDIYELTPVQEGMLFHTLYAPDRGDYIEQYSCILRGDLDVSALSRAWEEAIRRHPILRTSFHWSGTEKPLQVVHRNVQHPFEKMDWRGLSKEEQKARLASFLESDRKRGFDPARAPLTRFASIRIEDRIWRFIWTFHHMLLDGWCLPRILHEVLHFYRNRDGKKPLDLPRPRPFREYILWLQQRDLSRASAFWVKTLKGCAEPTPLIPERVAGSTGPGSEREDCREAVLTLSRTLSENLNGLSRRGRITPSTLFLGAWAILSSRYNLCEDLLFGISVSGRPPELPGAESMIGPLLQTIPARILVEPTRPVLEWLQALQEQQTECIQHAHLPLVSIQKMSGIPQGEPLFAHIFAFENYPVPILSGEEDSGSADIGFTMEGIQLREQTHYPAAAAVTPGKTYAVRLSYDAGRYGSGEIDRFLEHFRRLLESVAQDPKQEISALSLLDPVERSKILLEWNPAPPLHPVEPSIHRWIEAQAEKTPDAPAVTFEEKTLTYRELNLRANRLARYLIDCVPGQNPLIGICMERSMEMVVGILGILKAGGAYVPLDPDYPRERLAFMMADSGIHVLLSQEKLRPLISDLGSPTSDLSPLTPDFRPLTSDFRLLTSDSRPLTSVYLDTEWNRTEGYPEDNSDRDSGPEDLAYVIYTSGSTGIPKGVMIPQAAISNHMRWMGERFPLTACDRVLQKTPFSFDASVWEFFAPLLSGACLVLARPGGHQDMEYLARTLQEQKITVLQMVPSLLRLLLRQGRLASCTSLKRVFLGGEALSPALQEEFFKASRAELINLYGPTEACIDATYKVCAPGKPVTIGRPVQDTSAYILDDRMNPVPAGIPGELFIGGKGLARAYRNRPELTAAAFAPHPFSAASGQRLYRTGDLARYSDSGEIEYLGRRDDHLKISGYRIEAGEIENTLAGHPDVKEAAVLAVEGPAGGRHLTACVALGEPVPSFGPQESLIRSLREHLKARLPGYMVPSEFLLLESLPRLPNGKVDRRNLPKPEGKTPEQTQILPQDPLEELIAAIWSRMLNRPRIDIHENFFALGGDSLLATRVISKMRQALGRELPVRFLFDHPTIAEACETLRSMEKGEKEEAPPPLLPVKGEEDPPLSFAQSRLWFLNQLGGMGGAYNMPAGMRIEGPLDPDVLEKAVNEIIRRHEALRTTFAVVDGSPVQKIHPHLTISPERVDLIGLERENQEEAVRKRAEEEARKPFDLEKGPLLRLVLLRLSPTEDAGTPRHVLLITLHHIISDGWSLGVFSREFEVLYTAMIRGLRSPLPDLAVQYKDYGRWQRRWLAGEFRQRQLAYWKKRLAGAPAALDLPLDRPRPPAPTGSGRLLPLEIESCLTLRLKALSDQANATLFMTLLGAFAILLSRYSGQEDVLVGIPTANRNRVEVEPLIGFFVNTLVHRVDLSGDPDFQQLLARIRRLVLDDCANQDIPFEELVKELAPERDMHRNPLFQVMFVMQNMPRKSLELPGLTLTLLETETSAAKFDLTLSMAQTGDTLSGLFEYNPDLFDQKTMERMRGHFHLLLETIADHPNRNLSEISLLTSEERQKILVEWNRTDAAIPGDLYFHDRIHALAMQTPDQPAVESGEEVLTYRRLDARANFLAHHLRNLGVGPESIVGICMPRSVKTIIGILAILKAGGAYLPLDPAYPQDRLAFMLEDACVKVLLTSGALPLKIPETLNHTVRPDRKRGLFYRERETGPEPALHPQNPAYVIYTSGTTGRPKGVVISHHNLCYMLPIHNRCFKPKPGDRILQTSSLSFDASVFEIVLALGFGATLVLAGSESLLLGPELTRQLRKLAITHLTLPPSALAVTPWVDLPRLRYLVVGGEACPADLPRVWRRGRSFINVYGPTECTVIATRFECGETNGNPPIGRPLPNARMYVLDRNARPVPIGVPGELHIGGQGLSRGYLRRPDLTAEKFIPDPFSDRPGARLYKTGDLVLYLADGNIEFLGRLDHQVKIRGFRVETGEIEAVLNRHPAVSKSIVVARRDPREDLRLAAYIVAGSQAADRMPSSLIEELRDHLRNSLPDYMIPASWMILEALPLTPNGKIDRKALPEPSNSRETDSYLAPRDIVELTLQHIWQKVLEISPIGVRDNFFDLGGHSLLAVNLIARIREKFARPIPVAAVFTAPAIEKMAMLLRQEAPFPRKWSPLIPIQPLGGNPPLFCIHPAGGGAIFYVDLARRLGTDQPVYGLQPRGLDDASETPHTRVEEMADCYTQAVLEQWGQGPYRLAGASFGGLVAFEMACRLEAMGKEVSLLTLFDTYTPTSLTIDPVRDDIALLVALWEDELGVTKGGLCGLTPDQALDHMISRARGAGLLPPDFSTDLARRILDMTRISVQAAVNYRPGPYRGDMVLFRAEESARKDEDPALGWKRFVKGNLMIRWVRGTHQNMVREPQVENLASCLKQFLRTGA